MANATIGNYELLEKIGEGGFGRTYKARHIHLDVLACVKQNINVTALDTKILRDEARLLWGVNHHSLPSMKDFYSLPDGSHALVMDYIPGKNIEQIVEKYKAIQPEAVCWIAQRVLQAFHYLHAKGIVHSDVKPQNIIIQKDIHNAILVDYGLSCLRPKSNSVPVGMTAAYAAPELQAGRPPLPESDFYGLGLTMIRALGGDISAKEFPKHTPQPLVDFTTKLLKFDPMERPRWESTDLVKELSDVRLAAFGRRHSIGGGK